MSKEKKIFISDSSDDQYLLVEAYSKKEAVEKIKEEIGYEDSMLMGDSEQKLACREMVSSVTESKDPISTSFYEFFLLGQNMVYIPKFSPGYKSNQALKSYAERQLGGKIFNDFQFEKLQKDLKKIEKVGKYDSLREDIIRAIENN